MRYIKNIISKQLSVMKSENHDKLCVYENVTCRYSLLNHLLVFQSIPVRFLASPLPSVIAFFSEIISEVSILLPVLSIICHFSAMSTPFPFLCIDPCNSTYCLEFVLEPICVVFLLLLSLVFPSFFGVTNKFCATFCFTSMFALINH